MVWKSNLDENEQEFIEDFGAKSSGNEFAMGKQAQAGGVPSVGQRRPPTGTRPAARTSSAMKSKGSPERSVAGGGSRLGGGAVTELAQEPQAVADADEGGVAGTGEELAQALRQVVAQLDILQSTVKVLDQRVSKNEESVANVMAFFQEVRAQREGQQNQQSFVRQTNLGFSQSQGNVISAYGGGLGVTQGMSTNGGLQRQGFDGAISFN